MRGRAVVDTNILIYADDAAAGPKRERARDVLRELAASGHAVVSTQILQEYFVVATRKLGMSAEGARLKVEEYMGLDVVLVRQELILAAIDLVRLGSISFWDALVVKTAVAARCARVITEDLNHDQVIDGVRIENPFLAGARERRVRYAATRRGAGVRRARAQR